MRHILGTILLACLATTGCRNESTAELSSQSCFDLCLDASADFDLQGHLAIATQFRDSLELARGGIGAYVSVARSLSSLVQAFVESKFDMPAGLSYAGNGVFTVQPNPSTQVQLRFYLATDTSYGSAGELIDFNLFDVSNYFGSLGVKVSGSIGLGGISTSVDFTFDHLGPGAELLGIPATAKSPVSVNVGAFSAQLAKVVIAADIIEQRTSETTHIAYTLSPESGPSSGVGSNARALRLTNLSAGNAAYDQSLSLQGISLNVLNAGAAYDGTVLLVSNSPDFSFQILLSYDASATASITLGCLGVTLHAQ